LEPRSQLAAGIPTPLAKGVRRIVAPNAGLMTGTGTNTYLLGTREIAVLDPGPDDAAHLQAILTASVAPIRWIIVTHTHRDHSPLAARLVQATGARLIGLPPPADGRQDETFGPDDVPRDGERLPRSTHPGTRRIACAISPKMSICYSPAITSWKACPR
jgi:glyoxylase-like metal-dependent hydrolase (beta-lactamase superfamily II)